MSKMCDTRVLWITLIGIVATVSGASYTLCEDGWLPFKGYCYLFGTQMLHFVEAEHYCRQLNSHVIEVRSSLENAFIKNRLRDTQHRCFWIGLSDESIEGVWMLNSNHQQPNFTDWHPGQPNSDGDCARFSLPSDYFEWGDGPCTATCAPLCKAEGGEGLSGIVGRR